MAVESKRGKGQVLSYDHFSSSAYYSIHFEEPIR